MEVTKALLLFNRDSVDEGAAYPEILIDLMQDSRIDVQWAYLEDLIFDIRTDSVRVTIGADGQDLSAFDVIYFRRFSSDPGTAYAAAHYAAYMGVSVVDAEVLHRHGSVSKLTQYAKLAIAGLPIPHTFFAHTHNLQKAVKEDKLPFGYPFIIKAVAGTRGADNFLVRDKEQALAAIDAIGKRQVVAQEFISNHGDYRVWVLGSEIGPVYYRQKQDQNTHLNNTSQGGSLTLVLPQQVPKPVGKIARRAALLLERNVAGVDIVESADEPGMFLVFEVNRAPQIEKTMYAEDKAKALVDYLIQAAEETTALYHPDMVGRSEKVQFPELLGSKRVPARIDTGATTSALWASDVRESDGVLRFRLFDKTSPDYDPEKEYVFTDFSTKVVASSVGLPQRRYLIKIPVKLKNKVIRASFTLADRSTQVYPVLIGRNVLRGKFIVDVRAGKPLFSQEKRREKELDEHF